MKFKLGEVKILETMKKFPAGAMVVPLLLGCLINTLLPDTLLIGGFTTGLFKNAIPTLIGLFLFCSGAQIDVKMAGDTLFKGVVLTALKFFVGFGIGVLLNNFFGPAGILGLTPLAVIGAVTNSNGVIYATLASEYGDDSDVGATSILAINDGPFFTMIALGAAGIGNFPITAIMASIIPIIIGFIIGNLDHEWRKVLATGMVLLPPFNGFALGAGLNFMSIAKAGIMGVILGLMTLVATGLLTFIIYSLIRRKADPMGAAIGTTAGVAATTPTAVAQADPTLAPYVETATAQTAAAVVITAVLCPLMVSALSKFSNKWNKAHGISATTPSEAALESKIEKL
ncbi:MAG: 2-keto-3-deoxygluconate permease [Lachnospiraceae bacterium]|nr:2-keto-3-deoxygluconate permease [Lachnospiraceae bacterium]